MVQPIVLNEFGDMLLVGRGHAGEELTEESQFSQTTYIGWFGNAGINIFFRRSSKDFNMVFCPDLGLCIHVPAGVNTYGKLRQWCAEKIKEKKLKDDMLNYLWAQYRPIILRDC